MLWMVTLNSMAQDEMFETRGRIENMTESASASSQKGLRKIGSTATAPLPCTGSPKVPVILVQFPDMSFTVAETEEAVNAIYQEFFNAEKDVQPCNSYCSVKTYFQDQSNQLFTPDFDVIGPVTLPKSYTYYGEDNGKSKDIRVDEFYREACLQAIQKNVDWSLYDNDGNGVVDFAFFLYAGHGQNQKGQATDLIWPKETTSYYKVQGDDINVAFGASGCACELYKGKIDGIGACVHELCHGLGLPDFYDYDYEKYGMDYWDVMDAGCYKLQGRMPIGLSAYELDFLGWRKLVELEPDEAYTLTIDPLEKGGVGYKVVNKANPDEYFILENRQNIGMDQYIGYALSSHYNEMGANHGLMISHVDYKSSTWNSNTVNTSKGTYQGMTIVPADQELISSNKKTDKEWVQSQHGDLYPGENNVTEITSYDVYTGGTLGQTINNITEQEDGTITVDINGGKITEPDNPDNPDDPDNPDNPDDPDNPDNPDDPDNPDNPDGPDVPLSEPDIPEIA